MIFLKKIFLAFNPRERAVFWTATAVLFVSLTALAAAALNRATTVVPARGGEYIEGVIGQPTYINPVLAAGEADKIMVRLLFADLVALADKLEPDANGRTWRVRLKEGLKWSDGEKLTSDDVIFTVQKIQDAETQSPLFMSWQGVAANRLSELEVQFNLVAPYPFFLRNLEGLYILPKHLFADTPPANWRLSEYNLKPVGSGPFMYEKHLVSPKGFVSSYRLVHNPNYVGGEPLIQDFGISFFSKPEDMVKAFNTGEIDGFAGLEPEMLDKINRPYQSLSFRLPSYYAVFWNQGQNLALKDQEVRRALTLAVNRKELVDKIFAGRATPVDGLVILEVAEAAAEETATAVLDAANWKPGENGIREKNVKNGKIRLEFNLLVPDVPFLVKTAGELEAAWAQIGAQANVTPVPAQDLLEGAVKNREYQAVLFGNILNPPEDPYSFWHSNERFYPGLNLSLYNNREADALMENIRRNFDPAAREAELKQLNDIIQADQPAVFLYSPNYEMIATKELRGVPVGLIADPADRFRNVSGWHLKTARALK